jgi:DNA-binding MarR family transcriptional regulator
VKSALKPTRTIVRSKPKGARALSAVAPQNGAAPVAGDTQPDPVSTIVAQWQRERPDIDPAPMLLFGLVARSQTMTTAFINKTLAKWKLSRPSFDVLATLRRAGPPYSLTPKHLSESLMLSGAGMTSRLDRLESLHLIARLPEPSDRRSLKIQLTDRGVRLIDEVIPDIVAAQWKIAAGLGQDKTEEMLRLLGRFADLLAEDS